MPVSYLHNVHNLLYLCSDVRTFGPVDNFSAFRFENFMTSIKKQIRKNEKPLQQLVKRDPTCIIIVIKK